MPWALQQEIHSRFTEEHRNLLLHFAVKVADKGMAKTPEKGKRTPNVAVLKSLTPDDKPASVFQPPSCLCLPPTPSA
jgi:hypothetical protein